MYRGVEGVSGSLCCFLITICTYYMAVFRMFYLFFDTASAGGEVTVSVVVYTATSYCYIAVVPLLWFCLIYKLIAT
jgi:hypothetical protein